MKFLSEVAKYEERRQGYSRHYIRERYNDLFGRDPPAKVPLALVKAKIAYHLQLAEFKKYNCEQYLSPSWWRRYKAAAKLQMWQMPRDMRILLQCADRTYNGGSTMGKTEGQTKEKADRSTIGKTWGLNIKDTWHRIMEENPKKKLTDQQISDFLKREFPERRPQHHEPKGISRIRTWCNANFQPKTPYLGYDENGAVVTRGHREPKAKTAKAAAAPVAGAKKFKVGKPANA
jgi:hypothetical protein